MDSAKSDQRIRVDGGSREQTAARHLMGMALTGIAQAQNCPEKAVTVIVPFPAAAPPIRSQETSPAITDLLGGQVDASWHNINAIIGRVKAGKLKALAAD
jgi:tripartite-type tricarboxylate transporter receptor subunit TctC